MDDFVTFIIRLGLGHPLVGVEAALTPILAIVFAAFARRGILLSWQRWFGRIARHKTLCICACAVLPMALRCMMLAAYPAPAPFLHDEFGNLVLADTFANGRLANPPHPFAIHFETFHVVQQPRYFSYRPPAPGVFLALGRMITGSFWGAVCLSMALMCGAVCWMLYRWFPPGWAALGGLLCACQIGVLSYWMNSYWGGEWAALGGALLLGGLAGVIRSGQKRDAVICVVGLGIMVHTRPFEGTIFSLVVAGVGLWELARRRSLIAAFQRVAVPAVLALGVLAGATLFYNWRLTGSIARLPYMVGVEQYKTAPQLAWEKPVTGKIYHHAIMRECLVDWEMSEWRKWQERPLFVTFLQNMAEGWQFFIRPALTLPLFLLPWTVRDRRMRALVLPTAAVLAGTLVCVWYNPHYIAPATPAIYGIVIQGLRHIRAGGRRRPGRQGIMFAVPVLCAITLVSGITLEMRGATLPFNFRGWSGRFLEIRDRERIIDELRHLPGDHLVLVRYSPHHDYFEEWVYNEADIDRSRIVWAREMEPWRNEKLMQYFHRRRVWLLEPDKKPVQIVAYPAIAEPSGLQAGLPPPSTAGIGHGR